MGEWVTNRHTRHAFVAAIAASHPIPVVLQLAGHAGHRVRPAEEKAAIRAQFQVGWASHLDAVLPTHRVQRAACPDPTA